MATTTPKLHLKKPAYSDTADIQDINDNMDILDQLLTPDAIAIIVDGDTAGMAVAPGAYAYIKNNTHGLAEGLYKNKSSSAFPTSGGTADSTVFEAVSGGLGSEVTSLNSKISTKAYGNGIGITHEYKPNQSFTAGTAKLFDLTKPTGFNALVGVCVTGYAGNDYAVFGTEIYSDTGVGVVTNISYTGNVRIIAFWS